MSPLFEDSSETKQVSFFFGEKNAFRLLSAEFFGRILRRSELFGLCGAPRSSTLHVGTVDAEIYIEFLETERIGMMGAYRLRSESDGLCLIIDSALIFQADCRGCGIGFAAFQRQVHRARHLGFRKIRADTERKQNENGHYTWPRFGFDAPLPSPFLHRLPVFLHGAASVLDVMEFPAGRIWWKEHGIGLSLQFDLRRFSRSMTVFLAYSRRRRTRSRVSIVIDGAERDNSPEQPPVSVTEATTGPPNRTGRLVAAAAPRFR